MTGRRYVAALVAVLLTALLPVVPTSAAGRKPSPDRPWTGYPVPRTDRAASGWIGARRLAGATVYRIDPARRVSLRGYRPGPASGNVRAAGGRRVGAGKTACAALLLGRYGVPRAGSRRDRRLQAAAVDVAVQHLLTGRGYRYDGAAQRRRTDQRANGPLIRAYAERLVVEQCRFAGPYRVSVDPVPAIAHVGDRLVHAVTVRSRTGAPVVGATVVVAGVEVRTDAEGRAEHPVAVVRTGPMVTRVAARRLPPATVRVLLPRRARASRLVVAGLRLAETHVRTTTVAVLAQPTVTLTRVPAKRRGQELRPRFVLRGSHPGRRTATVQVFGPYADADPPCGPAPLVRHRSVVVERDGARRTTPFTLSRAGTYRWRVVVPGDDYNEPVERCGNAFRVR